MNSQNNRLGRLRRAEMAEAGMRAVVEDPDFRPNPRALEYIYMAIEAKRARRIAPRGRR
jgi:hypothetical protein